MVWDRRLLVVLALLAGALAFAAGVKYGRLRSEPPPVLVPAAETVSATETTSEQEPKAVRVHVAGAVARPGVYELAEGARVMEAVQQAGPLPEADVHALNLAAPLADGQKITVPRQGESPAAAGGPAAFAPGAGGAGGPININVASAQELEALPGIGPTLAQRIVAYREEHGPFRTVEDIKNVSGIGEGRYAQIKELITVY
ncbi:MAG: ComEA family DNA-binding protein [Clostridia bacterium]|nr:ComEA family DNA-binding protein [Clostridia bacterium]MDH7573619.1 ComEA family DNA-binding protein [Clostridia bacterium]